MHGKSSIFQEWTLYPSHFDVFNQHSHTSGWNLVLLLQADIGRTELGIGGWYSSKEWNVGLYGHTWRRRPCSGAQALGCKLGNNPSLKMKLKYLWKKTAVSKFTLKWLGYLYLLDLKCSYARWYYITYDLIVNLKRHWVWCIRLL